MGNQKPKYRIRRKPTVSKQNRYYILRLKQKAENENIKQIEQSLCDMIDNIDECSSLDEREYKSNVYDIVNGDNYEDYAKEFYDYYKECFEDLYEDN